MAKCYPIGPITGLLKPRYRVISNILGDDFDPIDGLDIFIDLNTLVTALSTSQKFIRSLPFAENTEIEIISGILMTVKHWKDFSRKWENVRIILFVNEFDMPVLFEHETLQSYLIPYVNKFKREQLTQFTYYWGESIKRVELVLKYIPNVYLIRCDRFDSYVIPNIIEDYDISNRHRIIVSNNSMMTNYWYMKNTHIIFSRYRHTGMSQLSDPLMIAQSLSKIDDDIMSTFVKNRVLYNLLNIIIGDFDRGITGCTTTGITYLASNLLRAIERREIPENPESIDSVLPVVDKAFHDYIRKSYPLVDIPSHTMLIPKSQIEKVKSCMVDLYDIDGLKALSVGGLNLIELL